MRQCCKSANVEKRRCHVARTGIVTNCKGDTERSGSAFAAVGHREQNHCGESHHQQDAFSGHQMPTQEESAVRFAFRLLQGKWKISILCRLQEGPARLADLRRLLPQASKKMLTQHLRQMERDGLIIRTDLTGKVPHIEYSLSKSRGGAVSRLFQFLATWSAEYPARDADPDENESSLSVKWDSGSIAYLWYSSRRLGREFGPDRRDGRRQRSFAQESPLKELTVLNESSIMPKKH